MKNFFLIILLFFFFSTNFAVAQNMYREQILCGILDVGCLVKKISNFGNNFFTSVSEKTPQKNTSPSQQNKKSDEMGNFQNNSNESINEIKKAKTEDVDGSHTNDDEQVSDEEETQKKDDSLLCKLGIFCSDQKKEPLEEKQEKDLDYKNKVDSMTEDELAQNPPEPIPGTSEYNTWGQNGEGEQPYELQFGQQYIQEDFSQSNLKPALTESDVKDFKLSGTDKNCLPFGVINKSNNIDVVPQVKSDLGRICSAFQRKLVVVDAVRAHRVFSDPCQPPSRHLSAEAVDFEINKYGTRQEQAMLIVAFIALGYNIGSYEDGYPLHADHGQCQHWQTWSRWAHKNGKKSLPYQQQVVDALGIMGIPARSAGEFNRNGRKSREFMVKKAKDVINNSGNEKLIQFLLPQAGV